MITPPYQRQSHRRGMLLLLVMLMLSLFMAIGAWLLTITLRSRASARAYGNAALATTGADNLAHEALEGALLSLLRGGTDGSVTITGTMVTNSAFATENMLADKYGPPITGSATVQPGPTEPLMTLTLTSEASETISNGQRLNGRILTLIPNSDDGDIASFRIVSGTGATSGTTGAITCKVANVGSANRKLPTKPAKAVINGREFTPAFGSKTPEPYDGYDAENVWLAQPVLANGNVDGYARVSFGPPPTTPSANPPVADAPNAGPSVGLTGARLRTAAGEPAAVVDNDNDGVLDGVWLPTDQAIQNAIASGSATLPPYVIADRPSALGGTIRFQVSYLVLDLDGRINLNAAGMAASPGSYSDIPAEAQNVPLGMGYGPADIDPSVLLSGSLPAADGIPAFIRSGTNPTNPWNALLRSGTPALSGTVPTQDQRRTPPKFDYLEGRYGPGGVPGIGSAAAPSPTDDDSSSSQATANTGSHTSYQRLISGSNFAITDVQGRRKLYMSEPLAGQLTPRLTTFTGATITTGSGAANQDATNDPYELRLDADAPRPGVIRRAPSELAQLGGRYDDNPFTLGELERILRPNDPDALQLPQRLAAGLGDFAQRNRMTVTTDSWDTPGLTGNPARLVEEFLASGLTYTGTQWRTTNLASGSSHPISPDIAAGLKFDLNRPIANASDRHEYCKGLYSLVVMLAGENATDAFKDRAAQWAVNVLDFRDEDSTMTGFEYDTNIADGWNVDGDPGTTLPAETARKVVWGVERPEILIVETAAWHAEGEGEGAAGDGQLFINLLRVPEATAAAANATTITPLTGTSSLTTSNVPPQAWQIRFRPDHVVQLFNEMSGVNTQSLLVSGTVGSGTVSPRATTVLTRDPASASPNPMFGFSTTASHLCLRPSAEPQPPYSIHPSLRNNDRELKIQGDFRLQRQGGPQFTREVFLERLADVNRPNGEDNPYIVVDTAWVTSFQLQGNPRKSRRPGPRQADNFQGHPLAAFWQQPINAAGWRNDEPVLREYEGVDVPGKKFIPYFHWPNRPFISQAELAHVPSLNSNEMLRRYSFPNTQSPSHSSASLALDTTPVSGIPFNAAAPLSTPDTLGNLVLDATHVPSRFAGNTLAFLSGVPLQQLRELGLDILQSSSATIQSGSAQLSKWREPGKINVNTIVPAVNPTTDNTVWQALMSGSQSLARIGSGTSITTGTITTNPFVSVSGSSSPATGVGRLLTLGASLNGSLPMEVFTTNAGQPDLRDLNPSFSYWRANRLANSATVRSQVFAVWITVKITDDSPNAPSPITRRMFAIIDRSIPVGYAPGQDLNVRDTIRLKRYLD